jgi:hypothetical protein
MANEPRKMTSEYEAVAWAILEDNGCGLTLETGKRVFCDDERLSDGLRCPSDQCACKTGASAAIKALDAYRAGWRGIT